MTMRVDWEPLGAFGWAVAHTEDYALLVRQAPGGAWEWIVNLGYSGRLYRLRRSGLTKTTEEAKAAAEAVLFAWKEGGAR